MEQISASNIKTPPQLLMAVSAPPFWHCGRTVRSNRYQMLLALLPVVAMAIWHWGLPAARVMALAMTTGVIVEALCQKAMGREISVDDFSGATACLLFSFLLPAAAPWWMVMIGAAITVSLGKMAFGGLGANPVNSSLVGWAMLYISWPVLMDPNAAQLATTLVDPLVRLKYFGAAAVADTNYADLLLGAQLGALGAAQIAGLFLGGSYLCARGILRWEIALSFFAGVLLTGGVYNALDPVHYASPFFHLCVGSTLLSGFFLATEPASSPDRPIPMFLYGLIGGAMVIIIRVYGIHVDGAPFAVLLINLLTPLLEMIRPKPFGVR
ncbi:MAG: RnfABCDGE type electron transport complex subunit D [Desulfovibrionaceae bacterium]